ncbi:MAG: Crp/Fnr family transcriptional regulator, partial [Pseudomonadota bacterium]
GSTIYSEGDEGTAVYTIRSGLVKLVQYLPDGSQRIVRLLRQGDTSGLEATVGQPYEHSAVVLKKVLACRIPKQVIERLSRETPRLHSQLMRRWYTALKQADDWLTELSTGKAPQRLARFLLQTMEADGTALLFTREDLGAMLGITTEHASRTVAEFKRNKTITEISPNRFRCNADQLECIAAAEC